MIINEELLNARDRESKLAGKEREDRRRGARQCRIKPGDKVIVERQTRAKGESRFSPTQYTVTNEDNGNLTLSDGSGHVVKRHVTQVRKISEWRKEKSDAENPEQYSTIERKARQKKTPTYLQDYVQPVAAD